MAFAEQYTSDFKGDHLSIRMFGARGDGRLITDGAVASGSTTFTSASSLFTGDSATARPDRTGHTIQIVGAGPGGTTLRTTIAAVVDDTTVTLSDAASTAVSSARATYGTDDAPALRAALGTGRNIFLPKTDARVGDYYLLNSIDPDRHEDDDPNFHDNDFVAHMVTDGQEIFGERGSRLLCACGLLPTGYASDAKHGAAVFGGLSLVDVTIRDFTIHMNGLGNLTESTAGGNLNFHWGVLLLACSGCLISRLTVLDCPGRNCIVFGGFSGAGRGDNNRVHKCTTRNGGTSLPGNSLQVDFSAIYVDSTRTVVSDCVIEHDNEPVSNCGGIELHADQCVAEDNDIQYSFPAIYMCADESGVDSYGQRAVRNRIRDCHAGITFSPSGATSNFRRLVIDDNEIVLKKFGGGIFTSAGMTGILQPRDDTGDFTTPGGVYTGILIDSQITNNRISENGSLPSSVAWANGVSLSAADNLKVTGNTISTISGIPIIVRGCPSGTKRLYIEDNHLKDWGQNTGPFSLQSIYVDWTGSATTPSAPHYDAETVHIRKNRYDLTSSPSTDLYGAHYFDWGASSVVADLIVELGPTAGIGRATWIVGPKASLVQQWIRYEQGMGIGGLSGAVDAALHFGQKAYNDKQLGTVLKVNGGFSATYNGIRMSTNVDLDESPVDDTLPSWRVDHGGFAADSVNGTPASADTWAVERRAAGDSDPFDWVQFLRMFAGGTLALGRANAAPDTSATVDIKDGTVSGNTKIRIHPGNAQDTQPIWAIMSDDGLVTKFGIRPAGNFNVQGQNQGVRAGNGSPEGAETGFQGDIYLDATGQVWYKSSGNNTNTGWVKLSGLIVSGSGSPEGVVSAPVGTLYVNTDNDSPANAGEVLWVKESGGSGSSGWKSDGGTIWGVVSGTNHTAFRSDKYIGIGRDPDISTGHEYKFHVAGNTRFDDNINIATDPDVGYVFKVGGKAKFTAAVRLDIGTLTAVRPLKIDTNKDITSGKIDLGSASDVAATGMLDGYNIKWDSGAGKFVSGLGPIAISDITGLQDALDAIDARLDVLESDVAALQSDFDGGTDLPSIGFNSSTNKLTLGGVDVTLVLLSHGRVTGGS